MHESQGDRICSKKTDVPPPTVLVRIRRARQRRQQIMAPVLLLYVSYEPLSRAGGAVKYVPDPHPLIETRGKNGGWVKGDDKDESPRQIDHILSRNPYRVCIQAPL